MKESTAEYFKFKKSEEKTRWRRGRSVNKRGGREGRPSISAIRERKGGGGEIGSAWERGHLKTVQM